MEDRDKTKTQLIQELVTMRQRLARYEEAAATGEEAYRDLWFALDQAADTAFKLGMAPDPTSPDDVRSRPHPGLAEEPCSRRGETRPFGDRDLSRRKRAVDQLRFTQFAVEGADELIFWSEAPSLRFVYVNETACRFLGYSRQELLSMKVCDVDPDFNPETWQRQRQEIGEAGASTFETRLRRKDGSLLLVEITVSLLSFEGGDFKDRSFCCAFARDITRRKSEEAERRRLETGLQKAHKLESLGVLAGGLAHDFNNLLTGILGRASMAQMDLPEFSQGRRHLQQIEEAAQRAAELTHRLLAYAGQGKCVAKPIDFNHLVRETLRLEAPAAARAALQYELDEDLPPVNADPVLMRQVIVNLATNAAEALAEKPGQILVHTGVVAVDRHYLVETYLDEGLPEGRYVFLDVKDTGVGMDDRTQARIFDPFFTTKFAGRGLGLAAVLGIMRRHQGAIKIQSQPGRGTHIRLLLPMAQQQTGRLSPRPDDADVWRENPRTILVIDDEETVRTFAKTMLAQSGFAVLTAEDGRQGIEVFRRHRGEITGVLLDMTMPHLDGRATFREIRRVDPQAKVILMSGYSHVSSLAEEGFAGFVHKPFRPQDILTKLKEALGNGGPPQRGYAAS